MITVQSAVRIYGFNPLLIPGEFMKSFLTRPLFSDSLFERKGGVSEDWGAGSRVLIRCVPQGNPWCECGHLKFESGESWLPEPDFWHFNFHFFFEPRILLIIRMQPKSESIEVVYVGMWPEKVLKLWWPKGILYTSEKSISRTSLGGRADGQH